MHSRGRYELPGSYRAGIIDGVLCGAMAAAIALLALQEAAGLLLSH